MYYFQFTLNSYAQDVEAHVPNKQKHIIPAFKKLSDMIGPDRVIWRYDPIFLNDTYTPEYHIRYFERIAKELSPYTKKMYHQLYRFLPKYLKKCFWLIST